MYNVYIQCTYILYTFMHTQWFMSVAWYLGLPFTLEHSYDDSATITSQREWTRKKRDQHIRICVLPPPLPHSPLYFSPLYLQNLSFGLNIQVQITSLGGVTSKSKRAWSIVQREENWVKWYCRILELEVSSPNSYANYVILN